jgi:multidrug efflux system membrane fusion protein
MRAVYKLGLSAIVLGVLITVIYSRSAVRSRSPVAGVSPVPVVTAQVQQRDVPIVLTGLGTVQALNTATIHVQVTGLLEEVDFSEGQLVKRGDVLARIDPRVFEATLAQFQGQLAKDTALHAQAQADLQRFQMLGKEDSIAAQQVQDQQMLVAQDGAKTQLDYTTLRAPFDGVTGLRLIDIGNVVHPTDTTGIVVVTQVQPISVAFTLPAADIPPVQAAIARGPVQATVYNQAGVKQLDVGTLLLINNQADPLSGTVQLKANFPNKQNQLWPGTFVNVSVTTSVVKDALTAPTDAVQQNDSGQYVFVVGADNRVTPRSVEVAQRLQGVALISKGLRAGETVVVQGQYRLTPGALVAAAPASGVPNSSTASAGMLP